MRAIVCRELSGVSGLELADVPTPEAGPNEVRVRVRTAGGDVIEGFYPDYRTGDHREQGAFWITGPGIAGGPLASPVSIADFAPTIGELLGVPLRGLDGRPIPGVAGGRSRESA